MEVRDSLADIPERRWTTVHGVRIAYRVWESARVRYSSSTRTVVLIHGNGARIEWWDAIAPVLPASRVIAVDLSGHGESGWRRGYDFDTWSSEVAEVMNREATTRGVTIVGHSMGGLVALETAWNLPATVKGVVMLDTPLRRFSVEQWQKRADIAARPLPRYATLDEAVSHFKTTPRLVRTQSDVWRHVARNSFRHEAEGWVLHVDPAIFGRRTDVNHFARPFPKDSYLVRAKHGLITDEVLGEMIPCLASENHMITVPATGHNLLLEYPETVKDLISKILGRIH